MKKRALFIPFLLFISPLAVANQTVQATALGANVQKNENSIRVSVRPEILGLWGMEIPSNNACTEYYNFKGDNEIVVKSDNEWSVGQFQYIPNQDQPSQEMTINAPPTLLMQINYENNEKDCSGNQIDQSGELSQYFVKWNTPTVINFCSTEQGEQCFATLRKVLP